MPSIFRALVIVTLAISISACTSARVTEPGRVATEQLLHSRAMDRVSAALELRIGTGSKVFVEEKYVEGTDTKYLLASIRDRVLRAGGMLASSRAEADLVLEPRVGAASIDRKTVLLGIPGFSVPVPLAGPLDFPELALFKKDRQQGVVKLAMTSYDAKTGELHQSSDPVISFSERTEWVLLFFIGWQDNDLMPEPNRDEWIGRGTFD